MDRSDASVYRQEMADAMQASEQKQDHIRNLNQGNIDYTVMDELAKAGFKDTFWQVNKEFRHSIPTKK